MSRYLHVAIIFVGSVIGGFAAEPAMGIFHRAMSQTSLTPPLILNPTPSSLTQGFTVTQTIDGTPNVSTPNYPNYWANNIILNSDDANVAGNFGSALTVFHDYGGSNMFGGRNSLSVYSVKTANTNASNTNRNYVGALFDTHAKASDGGTDPVSNPQGAVFGVNPQAILENGATSYLEVSGGEVDIAAQTGSSVYYKNALSLVGLSSDAVQGSAYDMMLGISAQASAVGSQNGIFFGNMNGAFPVTSSGTLIGGSHGTTTNGIDFSGITFTGDAFKSNGFTVAQNGVVFAENQYQVSGGGALNFQTRGVIQSPADGVLEFTNNAQTSFSTIQLGGRTSSSGAIQSFGTATGFRQADGSIGAFSQLTACSSSGEGTMAPVSDSTTATWGATISGTGSNHVLAYCDGTNWTVAAK